MYPAPNRFDSPEAVMRRAIEIARRGQGFVEPNPMVGAVLVDDELNFIGEGWHEQFGGPHAEVNAIRQATRPTQSTNLFVTLEPCNHVGRTPPCTDAVLSARIKKVYVATPDPAEHTDGKGLHRLRGAGIEVEVGLLEAEARVLTAPFRKRMRTGLPWVIAKWAMTLDGKIATHAGHSQWISSEASRKIVHEIRGRVDAIIVGRGTVVADNPSLTARPTGARVPLRVVLDRNARIPATSILVETARETSTIVMTGPSADTGRITQLTAAGVDVVALRDGPRGGLAELGQRGCTNVLVEGGSEVLGSFFDGELVDEAHIFIAPKIVGGSEALTPVAGRGIDTIPKGASFLGAETSVVGGDIYFRGRLHDR